MKRNLELEITGLKIQVRIVNLPDCILAQELRKKNKLS